MAKIAGTPSVIKQANMDLIQEIIQKNPGTTKPQIARLTQLSLVTVSAIVDELEKAGQVLASGLQHSTGGRKAMQYIINSDFGAVITILIRSGRYFIFVRDIIGKLICRDECVHEDGDWTAEVLDVVGRVREHTKNEVRAVGVAVPGTVSQGIVRNIPLIPQWEGFDLKTAIEHKLGIATVVENDINASALGSHENYGNSGVQNMVFLYLDDGIGAGVVIGNQLYKTKRSFVGEIGFMNIGYWDERKQDADSLETLVKELIAQDRRAQVTDIVARLLVNTCCVIDPDLIVIDSRYLRQCDVELIRQRFTTFLGADYTPQIVITQVEKEIYSAGLFNLCRNHMSQSVHIYN